MDLVLAVSAFGFAMFFFSYAGYPMLLGVIVGMLAFTLTALHRGYSLREVLSMIFKGSFQTLVVARILILIGIMTALWRSGGTFAFLVVWGMRLIKPSMFILMAYLIPAVVSYAIGTSFGVAGTAGVAIMMLARSAGVNPCIVAGAVMSGIYLGDRGSPASSCAALVAAVTGSDLNHNLRFMLKTSLPAVILTIVFYACLSYLNPSETGSTFTVEAFEMCFNLHPLAAVPAIFMILLPLSGVRPIYSFFVSIVASLGCTIYLQNYTFLESLRIACAGFVGKSGTAAEIFNGGGIFSMIKMCLVIIVSGTISGIFEGTGMLAPIREAIKKCIIKYGAFPVAVATGCATDGIFCNQTVGVMLAYQLLGAPYRETGRSKDELVQDMENSVVVIAGLIPWCVACFVPLTMLQAGFSSLPYSFYLYALPVTYVFLKKIWFKNNK